MSRLLAAVLSRAGVYLLLLALIVALLVGKDWITGQWEGRQKVQQPVTSLEQQKEALQSERSDVEAQIELAEADWHKQQESDAAPYRNELKDMAKRLEIVAAELSELKRQLFNLDETAKDRRDEANLANANLRALEKESWFTDKYLNQERYVRLGVARGEFATRDQVAKLAEAARDAKWLEIEDSPYFELSVRTRQLQRQIDRVFSSTSPKLPPLLSERDEVQQKIVVNDRELDEALEDLNSTPFERMRSAVSEKLPLALSILIGIILAPVAIKLAFYFGLAPIASRLPPIQIISDPSIPEISEFSGSAVSVDVPLGPKEELVVHPDFLQSSNQACEKRTRWLLNSRLPFSSLMSGMFFLTSIRPKDPAGSRVVVSSLKDPLGEVGIVEIPDGGAMVIQPRALAGVVKLQGQHIQISRHWRLNSAHAWLTLQLRYLVFHGPCRLILKGCRGVRIERSDPAQARLINQAGTLGFNANLGYKTVRTETFFPYLQGKEDLFNDLFVGDSGHFIYEELPNGGRKSGIIGRGLEGLTDAFLKAFGI